MKDADEFEMLLSEIPHATSSLNTQITHAKSHHHNLDHHGYGNALSVPWKINGRDRGMSDDELLKHKYACKSSPVSGFSLQSDGSSSSLFSGGHSFSDSGSPTPPQFEELKSHSISGNGFWSEFNRSNNKNMVDELKLMRNFNKMFINDANGDVSAFPDGIQVCDQTMSGESVNYGKGFSNWGRFNSYAPRSPVNFEGQDYRMGNLLGSWCSPVRSDGLFAQSDCENSASSSHYYSNNLQAVNHFVVGVPALNRPDTSIYASRNGMNLIDGRDAFSSPNVLQSTHIMPQFSAQSLLHCHQSMPNGRIKISACVRVPEGVVEGLTGEDGLIVQGEGLTDALKRSYGRAREQNTQDFKPQETRLELDGRAHVSKIQESGRIARTHCPFLIPSKCNSLAQAQGYIYHLAKDQHGCRFLQRMFDEGTSRDVQIIFSEVIHHVVELMMNPFGNYLMQKLLEVCNEDQRMEILLRVTEEPGELVRISLNTHGTRVVQKLIETLKTRKQISLAIAALEPGFLALIKDLNGNHVVQRCLQCFTNEDSKFIFVAAANFCVDIATHQHGCCVLQRCISHATGELRENLVAEISANGLLLAQDAFGNYVVQFILELEIPSAASKLTSQFEGNYVHLSTQKFGSHVVEKCLVVCSNETRSKIIHELLSATYFEQLLQDPHANYVVQTALRVSEGPVHNSLVDAIESHKAISRSSPYSKRIFSHKLLKK
ncbi:pumilio homolog 7, chloroplastic [Olea europaea subsp. europaea]|uniref:Pumilio homolog 7, chloroplastic n=1 Tax=Olea europaea subsp. europaea TaxID=158383 RepID=A0A8S0QNX5_OLEEU|nr:pumilio homolog 7, chloroplastic [Olea europaea subsp. europaea]